MRDQYFTYQFVEFRLRCQSCNKKFKLMAIKLPAVIYLGTRAQTPAKKKWLTFIQNSALIAFVSLLLLLSYFMKLLLSLHSTSLPVKHSRCRIKICCEDGGINRSRREMGCLASCSEGSYTCMVSGALSQFCWGLEITLFLFRATF